MKKTNKIIFSYFLANCLVLIYLVAVIYGLADNKLQVIFFDVGQGDSIFIRLPDRRRILIDGGADNAVLYRLGRYLPYFDRQIDLVIMTHSDSDHLNGLVEVCRRFPVKAIMFTLKDSTEPAYQQLRQVVAEKGIRELRPETLDRIDISDTLNLEILNPKTDIKCGNVNDCSIVLRLINKNLTWLFTGDISDKQEKILLAEHINMQALILKVAHHGSRYSTGDGFIKAVAPKLAIISVGENNFNHPGKETVLRLQSAGVKILTTQERGDIIITSLGEKYWIGY